MAMNAEQWRSLVHRLEPEARENREAYARKVALLGALGYGVIAFALLTLMLLALGVFYVAITGAAVFAKLLIPIFALGFVLVRSLGVKIEPPDGIELRRELAPELFRMIDEVNAVVQGPKVHHVLMTDDANAAVVQIPRRGLVFGCRNYLLLGLPYMQAMSPEELSAVVAHELGHLSADHGRFGTWVYRVQATWWQLLASLERQRSWSTGLFRRFFEWYVPRFDAYSFPLRRQHEYEADAAAAGAVGALPVATSLLTATVAGRHLGQRYWPRLYTRATHEQEPPRTAFAAIASEVASARTGPDAPLWIESELRREPTAADTHPSTLQRIHHLGLTREEVVAAAERPGRDTAAEAFLGATEHDIVEQLTHRWRSMIGEAWSERYSDAQEMLSRVRELNRRAVESELPLEDLRTLASLTDDLHGPEAAFDRYHDVLARDPDDAQANFVVGRLLLDRGDEAGLACLERAMSGDADCVVSACELAIEFLLQRGREQEAARFRTRGEQQLALVDAAGEERSSVSVDDDFVPHDLSPELVTHIRTVAEREGDVGKLYVVRRRTQHLDREYPFYVIAVVPKSHWRTIWRESSNDDKPSLADRVADELDLPVQFQLFVLGPRAGEIERRFGSYERSLVYDRAAA
jgi:Zn-dependent protease with chaperone function